MKPFPIAAAFAAATLTISHAQTQVEMTVQLSGQAETVILELDEKTAPKTTANFTKLVSEGFYNGLAFHRVIPNYIAQAGDPLSKDLSKKAEWGLGGPGYTVPAELGGKHVRGAIATARLGDAGNPTKASSGSQFFVCLTAIEALDGDYTVFGKVADGMDVMDRIANVATDSRKNPVDRVEITKMVVLGPKKPEIPTLTEVEPIPRPAPLTPALAATPKMEESTPAPEPSVPTEPAVERPKPLASLDTPASPAPETKPSPLPAMPDLAALRAKASAEDGFERPTSLLGSNPAPAPVAAEPMRSDDSPIERPTPLGGFGGATAQPQEIATTSEFQRPVPIRQQMAADPNTGATGGTTTIIPTGPTAQPGTTTPAVATPIPSTPVAGAPQAMPIAQPSAPATPLPAAGPPAKKTTAVDKNDGAIHKFLRRFW